MTLTAQEFVAKRKRAEASERSAVRWWNTRKRFLLILSVVLGAALAGIVFGAISASETQITQSWFLEGNKPNQASIWGRQLDSWFGWALAVGDVNGDGFDDLLTSARLESGSAQAGGVAYVIPGPLAFNEVYTIPHGAALVFDGISQDAQVGTYLDSGDMNGDGIDDIILGSWTEDTHVYLGSADIQAGSPMTVAVAPENMALTVSPAGDGQVLCDFNGDGYQDLFVEELLGESGLSVQVWGVLGSPTLTNTQPISRVLPAEADIVIKEFYPAGWGSPNARNLACGDIDGDGTPDLAIGIYTDSPRGLTGAGSVYVVRGDPAITASHPVTLTMPGQADAILEGMDGGYGWNGDKFGASVASADVNLDGRADLIVGAPSVGRPNELHGNAGEVYLWLGRALVGQRFPIQDQASWTVYGEPHSEYVGQAIATGDFDRDGYPEILLGCPGCDASGQPFNQEGRGYVLEPLLISGEVPVTAVAQLEIVPYDKARCLGGAVAAMDLNGDQVKDLVLSAHCTYSMGDLPGTVYVVSYPSHVVSFLPFLRK